MMDDRSEELFSELEALGLEEGEIGDFFGVLSGLQDLRNLQRLPLKERRQPLQDVLTAARSLAAAIEGVGLSREWLTAAGESLGGSLDGPLRLHADLTRLAASLEGQIAGMTQARHQSPIHIVEQVWGVHDWGTGLPSLEYESPFQQACRIACDFVGYELGDPKKGHDRGMHGLEKAVKELRNRLKAGR